MINARGGEVGEDEAEAKEDVSSRRKGFLLLERYNLFLDGIS